MFREEIEMALSMTTAVCMRTTETVFAGRALTTDIEVQGLDTNWDLVTQTITLTGQTRKALTTDLIRVFRMKNVGATAFVGNVFCYVNGGGLSVGVPDTEADVRAVMQIGNEQTLMALYSIPNGKTGYLSSFYFSNSGTEEISLRNHRR